MRLFARVASPYAAVEQGWIGLTVGIADGLLHHWGKLVKVGVVSRRLPHFGRDRESQLQTQHPE